LVHQLIVVKNEKEKKEKTFPGENIPLDPISYHFECRIRIQFEMLYPDP